MRLGSHTATGGILRCAALFVFIAIRGTLPANSPRAADSRTCLRFGDDRKYDRCGLTKSKQTSPNSQYTANAVCTEIDGRAGRSPRMWCFSFLYHENPAIVAGFHIGFADKRKPNKT